MSTAKIELANALKLVKELRIKVKSERLDAKLVRQQAREFKAQQLAIKKASKLESSGLWLLSTNWNSSV
jgi:hypothetical protein